MKKCKICKQFKELDEFYKVSKARSNVGDGRDTRCKKCVKKMHSNPAYRTLANAARKKRLQGPEYLKKYNRKKSERQKKKYAESEEFRKSEKKRISVWAKTSTGKTSKKVSQRRYQRTKKYKSAVQKYRNNNKHKRYAQSKLQTHIRSGRIIRPSVCDVCDKKCVPEGHHPDYSNPLDVIWMCHQCHIAFHWSVT